MSAVLPLQALIVLPNKLVLLVDRVFVNLQVFLLLIGALADAADDDDDDKHNGREYQSRENSSSLQVVIHSKDICQSAIPCSCKVSFMSGFATRFDITLVPRFFWANFPAADEVTLLNTTLIFPSVRGLMLVIDLEAVMIWCCSLWLLLRYTCPMGEVPWTSISPSPFFLCLL